MTTRTRIGLTGGIGTGKSAVAALLAERGAEVVDADQIARDVVAPGGPAYDAVAARFGPVALAPDGTLDRSALAALVFSDPDALEELNALTHPVIGAVMLERLESLDGPGRKDGPEGPALAVAVIPLLRPAHRETLHLAAVVMVDCATEAAVRRLVLLRGMDEADARARIAVQATREERLAIADYVVDNSSTPERLAQEVDALWTWLARLRPHRATP
ncbi:MAG: dephospho-CoA kinase [Acidimicrobiales bacterium]